MSGLARLLLTRGHPDVRQRAQGVAVAGRPAGPRRHHPHATRSVQFGRCRHGRLLQCDPGRPPGAGRGPGSRAARAAPLGGAGRRDDRAATPLPSPARTARPRRPPWSPRSCSTVAWTRRSSSAARSPRSAPTPTTAPASTSSPRPTSTTARSSTTGPYVAIVTNIDADHLNTYGDLAGLEDAFLEFCRLVGPGGFVVTLRRRRRQPAAGRSGAGRRAAGGDLRRGRRRDAAPDRTSLHRHLRPLLRHAGRRRAGRDQPAVAGPAHGPQQCGRRADHAAPRSADRPDRRCAGRRSRGPAPVRAQGRCRRRPGLRRVRLPPDRDDGGPADAAGCRRGRADCWWSSSRTGSTARAICARRSRPRWLSPTRRSSWRFSARARRAGRATAVSRSPPRSPCRPSTRCSSASWEDVAGEVCRRASEGDVVVTMGAPPISLMGDELLAALAARAVAAR